MKKVLPFINESTGTTALRRSRSVEPNQKTNSVRLNRTATEVRVPAKRKTSSVDGKPAAYHPVSPETLLSVSPLQLQHSASMLLLNKTAQVLSGSDQNLRRMPVKTASQVYEVRNSPSNKDSTDPFSNDSISRQESLIAVFKPAIDEDDGLIQSNEHVKMTAEERTLRERAAYILDKAYNGFSKVPPTALARVKNANGSLQEFVPSDGTAEDNPALVGRASVEEVQKIAILDCRIFNLDRHGGNVLVKKKANFPVNYEVESIFTLGDEDESETFIGDVTLTPIDHSLSLPSWTDLDGAWFDWGFWPQAKHPLTEVSRGLILSLNLEEDAERLMELGIKPECVATNSICTVVLQVFVRELKDVSLKMLSDFFQRPYPAGHILHNIESPLEHILNEVCAKLKISKKGDYNPSPQFFELFERIMVEKVRTADWKSYLV